MSYIPPVRNGDHRGAGARVGYLELSGINAQHESAMSGGTTPFGHSVPLLDLDTDVEYEIARLIVPDDARPISAAHDVLHLVAGPVRILVE